MHARAIWALLLTGCSGAPESADEALPRSTVQARNVDPALPEARPAPFEVELRRRDGAESMLLRATDQGLRYQVGRDPHDLTVLVKADAPALDQLYQALRDNAVQAIEGHPNPDADVDGTSMRLLIGRRRIAATRMGHFEPLPEHLAHYEACVAAIEALVPGQDANAGGVPLVIAFDDSMSNRRASVEVELDSVIALQSSPALTLRAAQSSTVQLRLRFGPPAQQIEQSVDMAAIGRVVITVDPELGQPTMKLEARGR